MQVELIAKTELSDAFIAKLFVGELYGAWSLDQLDTQVLCEFAGRACYQSWAKGNRRPGGTRAYFERILSEGHGSVLEHANYTFYLEGVSRSLTHELVRHRAGWSYSQLSQRFVDSKLTSYIVPPVIENLPPSEDRTTLENILRQAFDRNLEDYEEIQNILNRLLPEAKKKQVNEAARCVLPNMTETKIVVTANARALRHFFERRGAPDADAEIRGLAIEMYKLVEDELMFMDFAVEGENPNDYISNKWKKV